MLKQALAANVPPVRRRVLGAIVSASVFVISAMALNAQSLAPDHLRFTYRDTGGRRESASVITHYYSKPLARIDSRINARLRRAATIAEERAHARSKARCWHYVKEALVASGMIDSFPRTPYAWQAGDELVRSYGFKKLAIRDPYAAPVGAVLVYDRGHGSPGHVEIRTAGGFVSDYRSRKRCRYPLLGIYAKS